MWTLLHAGTEKSLADWGLGADLVLHRQNQAMDTVTVSAPGLMDAALAFAYGDAITIYRDRTGSGTSWSGGTKYFQGKAALPQRSGSGTAEALRYKFQGPWWDLERLVFQQLWKQYYGITSAPSGTSGVDWTSATINGVLTYFTLLSTAELFLGLKHDDTRQNTGAQITEALNWAITCGVNLQVGTIDPAVNIPSYNCRDVTVAEVIRQMLRWSPDCIAWFDYSTTVPTFHVRALANLSSVTVTPPTDKVKSLHLAPRYDLQLPAVQLRFKTPHTVDNQSWTQFSVQTYPGGATGRELGASVHSIDLGGSNLTRTRAKVQLSGVNAQSGTEATRIAWWQTKEQLLKDPKILATSLHITSATVQDETGATISLGAYPYELVDGTLPDWTGYNEVAATVQALATYDLYADSDHKVLVQKGRQKVVTVRLKLTNAAITEEDGITGSYSIVSSYTEAEPEPSGLAQAIYTSYASLQYEGQIVLVGAEIPTGLAMGKKLTIAGLDLTIADLLIQQIEEEPHAGRITLSLGPTSHLGVSDLIELLRVNRYRNSISFNSFIQGTPGTSGDVTLGKTGPRENTVAGHGEVQSQAAIATDGSNKASAQVEAAKPDGTPDPALVLQRVVTSTGVPVSGAAAVNARLSDLPSGANAKFRATEICVDGVVQTVYVLRTAIEGET